MMAPEGSDTVPVTAVEAAGDAANADAGIRDVDCAKAEEQSRVDTKTKRIVERVKSCLPRQKKLKMQMHLEVLKSFPLQSRETTHSALRTEARAIRTEVRERFLGMHFDCDGTMQCVGTPKRDEACDARLMLGSAMRACRVECCRPFRSRIDQAIRWD